MGGPGEAEHALAAPVLAGLPGSVDLVGSLTLPEAAAVLAGVSLFLGNDSGLMHLAAAAGAPTLGLFGMSPANEYAPFGPHAAAVVHQGGIGTTGQALRAGRPMLVVPFAHDQFDNAARVVRLGAARTLSRRRYGAASAASALAALLDTPQPGEIAAALGARLRPEAGVAAACDALERVLR